MSSAHPCTCLLRSLHGSCSRGPLLNPCTGARAQRQGCLDARRLGAKLAKVLWCTFVLGAMSLNVASRTSRLCGTAPQTSRGPPKRQPDVCTRFWPHTRQNLLISRSRPLPIEPHTHRELRVSCNSSGQAVKQTVPPGDLMSSTTEDLTVVSHENRQAPHQRAVRAGADGEPTAASGS